MSDYDIDPGVPAAIERFKLPETLGFGPVNAPVMFEAEWRDGGGAGAASSPMARSSCCRERVPCSTPSWCSRA